MTDEYVLGVIYNAKLDWQEHPQGGFTAIMNEITIHITFAALTLSRGLKKIAIHNSRPFSKKSSLLEQMFKDIRNQAANQCIQCYSDEYKEILRKEILSQLTCLNI